MASRLYEVLNDVENGRKTCISNAKNMGYDISDNATILDIANLFNVEPEDDPTANVWQRPSEWVDWETLVDWDTPDGDNLYPLLGILMYDSIPDMVISTSSEGGLNTINYIKVPSGTKVVTSDGQTYTAGATEQTHTWDVSQDINTTNLPYKLRYIILYGTPSNGTFAIGYNKSILEAYISSRNLKTTNINFCASNINYTQKMCSLQSIIDKRTGTISYAPAFYGSNIKRLELNATNVSYSNVNYTNSNTLEEVYAPNLTNVQNVLSPSYGYYCSLRKIYAPANTYFGQMPIPKEAITDNLKGYVLSSIPSSPNYTFNAPFLYDIYTSNLEVFNTSTGGISAHILNLPNTTSITITDLNTPIEKYNTPILRTMHYNFLFRYAGETYTFPSSFTGFTSSSSAVPVLFGTSTTQSYSWIKNLVLYNDWKISMDVTGALCLSRKCLLDMLDKLADVTGESDTYTLTLGTVNLSKLTSAEIAIGTAKGWVIN